jgi:import inner membrane translocase subunit TIM21
MADKAKNAAGTYQLLSLVIDVPATNASYPGRAVVFWSPEADTEGLLGRRPR